MTGRRPETAPCSPPSRVRESLQVSRAAGLGWEEAWPIALDVALDEVGGDHGEWRVALAWAASRFRAGYDRVDVARRPLYR